MKKKKIESIDKPSSCKFYEITQNNSGGSFVLNDKLTHRLIIEADTEDDALSFAEDIGCYWNGCDDGIDCSCCGDRWYRSAYEVNLKKINEDFDGYEVSEWITGKKVSDRINEKQIIKKFKARYPNSVWPIEPNISQLYGSYRITGKIKLQTIEEYAQIMANNYGWLKPDCRIFYKNGEIKEIFMKNNLR